MPFFLSGVVTRKTILNMEQWAKAEGEPLFNDGRRRSPIQTAEWTRDGG